MSVITRKYLFLGACANIWSQLCQWNCMMMPRYLELKEAILYSLPYVAYVRDFLSSSCSLLAFNATCALQKLQSSRSIGLKLVYLNIVFILWMIKCSTVLLYTVDVIEWMLWRSDRNLFIYHNQVTVNSILCSQRNGSGISSMWCSSILIHVKVNSSHLIWCVPVCAHFSVLSSLC